jgi:hypothetical protein
LGRDSWTGTIHLSELSPECFFRIPRSVWTRFSDTEASALQRRADKRWYELCLCRAIFDRYSTRIAKRIAGGCSKLPRDQDLYWLSGRPTISHRRRRLSTFISSFEVLLSNQGLEHNLRVAFAGNLPRRVNDPNSSAEPCPLLTLIPTDSPAPKFTAFFLFEFASLLFSLLRLSHSWSKFRSPGEVEQRRGKPQQKQHPIIV